MFSFLKNRPPLTVFVLCIFTLAVTLFCFAFYIKNTNSVPDSDRNHDWVMLLKHFNSLETCLESSDISKSVVTDHEFIDMTTVQTLVSINNTDIMKKFNSVKGFLSLDNWHTSCPKIYNRPSHMQVYFDIPEAAKTNVTEFDTCVTITGPEEYLPKFVNPNCAVSANKVEKRVAANLSTNTEINRKDFCKNGLLTKLEFYPQERQNFANYLSENEKGLIYIHLLWTSYFLVFILLIVLIYGTVHGDGVFDKYIHKFVPRN